ncbi:unnamed protein product [Effrenium voratum]|nr:unnamed protein product [Effrenium voratum]
MHATASSQHIFLERGSDHQCCVFESKLDWTELKPEISRRLQMVAMMREMPKNTYFLPWQKAQGFAQQILDAEPCWMNRAVQVPRTRGCFLWENSIVSPSLQGLLEGHTEATGRDYKVEIEVRPVDDFTLHAVEQGSYFTVEIDGYRLEKTFNDTHIMHITARRGSCGRDIFWSHFWPFFRSNLMMLSLFHAAREAQASSEEEVLKVRKSCRLLPPQELQALFSAASLPSPDDPSHLVPADHAAVERVAEWRRRALRAALRSPCSTTPPGAIGLMDVAMQSEPPEEAPSWVYRGEDLREEGQELGRWKGQVFREDWFRLIGKAEYWLAHAYLELSRREPGLGSPELACEVLCSGLSSGRLTTRFPGCARIAQRAQKALETEFWRALLAVDRCRLDRLHAAGKPTLAAQPPVKPTWIDTQTLFTPDMTKSLVAHVSHALRFAVSMKEKQALGYALIEAWRLCGDMLSSRAGAMQELARVVGDARQLYLELVVEKSCAHTGLAKLMMWQIYEQHSCFATGIRADWAENVRSPSFQADVQAFLDLIGARQKQTGSQVLSRELEVVEIQPVAHGTSMQAYLARREELKVSMHPKCAGMVSESLTVGATGPWTHNAIRRCQGMWADKLGYHFWLIAGEEVVNAASLVAEMLEPESAQILRNEHGTMNFRALPWPHLMSRPECADNDSEMSLLWVISQVFHTSRSNHKQINGVFQDADLNVIFWHSGHKDNQPARWDRSPVLFGHWWLQGYEALLLPMEVFLQGSVLLDQLAQHQSRACHHKADMEANFEQLRGQGVPSNYGAVLFYKGRFYPIWEERPGLASMGHFRSLHFTGTVDKSNRRMEIIPIEDAPGEPFQRQFPKRLFGFRKGITVRLSPKPLDANVNEVYLVQGTATSFWEADDSSRVQLQVYSSHSGSALGPGIYLTDSAEQADLCTEQHPNGLCAMLICRTCLGRVINQSEGDRRAMRRGSEYHCIKLSGEVNEYVVFDPAQVYVEYIVWYRRRYNELT